MRASTNQTFYGYLGTSDGTAQRYTFSFTASGNNAWTKITKTIPGNSNLDFDDDNGQGLHLILVPFYGTSYTNNKTLDTWAASDNANFMPDMASTWLTAGASTFDITGVQIEVGSVATDFEHRSFAQELALCERYFEVCEGGMTVYGTSGTYHGAVTQFSTKKRANPTVTRLSDTAIANSNTPSADQITTRAFRALAQSSGAFLQFQTVYSASSEL